MRPSFVVPAIGLLCLALAACEPSPEGNEAAPQSPAATPAATPAPVATPPATSETAAPISDAEALSEEELDRLLAEAHELSSRAEDLKNQVDDGAALLALKEQQIKEIEAKLKAQK